MTSSPPKSYSKYRKKISLTKSDTIGDFKIGSKIGQGTFSKVCMGIHIPTGEKVAIKILPKNQIKEKTDKIRIEKEISLQKKLHHQNIIHQYSVLDTENSIYIITEYCSGGELFDYIVSKRRLPEIEACRIFQQLINGLEYLHKQKICHRDLKPENLLFDSKHNLKIADFGLSNDYIFGKLSTPCGSPCYAAPEMVTGKKYFGDTVDIWSSGIVLYSMVCGYLPFEDDNQTILFHKIAKGLFSLPSFLSNSCKDLIKNILVTNPKKRYGFEEIKKHPWFMSVNNIGGKNILFNSPGILIDYDVIPIDIDIIKEIYYTKEYKNFSILNIVNDVIRNKHNKITTAYYLILKKKLRNNEESISNINSNSKLFIDYIKKPISKMEYWNNDYDKIIDYYTNKVKSVINKEKENKKNSEEKNKTFKKIKKYLKILSTDDISNILNEEEKQNEYIDSNFINEDLKLSTIVYDDEEKDLLKIKKKKIIKKKNTTNYNQKDTDDDYLEYKINNLNNYELDSDEPIMREMCNSSTNKKQFDEIVKTNENVVEENEKNTINNEDNENLFNKIIKNTDNSIDMIDNNKKEKGRNIKRNDEKKKNNSVCIEKNTKIKDLIFSEQKQINNKKVITEVYKNNNIDKKEKNKNNKNNKDNNIKNNESNYKKEKKKKINAKKFTLPNNSYYYRKIASMMDKEEKMQKYINKKKIQKDEKNRKNKFLFDNNYNKISVKLKNNRRNDSQENDNNYINTPTTNITNGQKESTSISKQQNDLSPNNNTKNNYENSKISNLKIKNINNYNIDIYKYKINLINNNGSYLKEFNLQELYKKLNDLNNNNRYNKYISTIQNKKKINNNKTNLKKKKYLNNSLNLNNNNNIIINKYLITENNNKIYKKSCPSNLNDLDIFNNDNIKNKINPILLSEQLGKFRKKINIQEKMRTNLFYNKSIDKNINLKTNKIKNIKKYLLSNTQYRSNSMENKEVKNKNIFDKNNIYNKNLEINNIYFSNISNNISILKDRYHKKNLITDINGELNRNIGINNNINNNKIHNYSKHYSNDIRNDNKYAHNENNNSIFNKNNIVYHKKFININRRHHNSVESDIKQKKLNLDLLGSYPNNKNYNNSLIILKSNKAKNKNILKIDNKKLFNSSIKNINNYNIKSSINNNKRMIFKKKYCLSQEKVNKNFYLNHNAFNLSLKSKNNNIQNNKSITKNENINKNNFYEKKVVDKINKMPSLICCKCSIDKIKETIEKIIFKNDKNNSLINIINSYCGIILKCKCINKIYNFIFELHVSSFNDAKNYILIKPSLLKGNKMIFFELFEKVKNELLN